MLQFRFLIWCTIVFRCSKGKHPYLTAVEDLRKTFLLRGTNPYLMPDLVFWRTKHGIRFKKAADVVHQHAEQLAFNFSIFDRLLIHSKACKEKWWTFRLFNKWKLTNSISLKSPLINYGEHDIHDLYCNGRRVQSHISTVTAMSDIPNSACDYKGDQFFDPKA